MTTMDLVRFSADAVMHAAELHPFSEREVEDAYERIVEDITSTCEAADLPFTTAQIRNAAWKRMKEKLHTLAAIKYVTCLEATLPKYANFDSWRYSATSDFLRTTEVIQLSLQGKQRRYGLGFKTEAPTWVI